MEDDLAWRLPTAKSETIRDLLQKRLKLERVSTEKIQMILQGDYAKVWQRFAEEYPSTDYIVHFSAVGFDAASSELVLLRRTKNGWSVRQWHPLWIS